MPRDMEKRLGSVLAEYNRLVRSLPEPLHTKARSLSKALAPEARNLVAFYGAAEAYPLLRLPLWLEDRYLSTGHIPDRKGYGVKVATASLFGYLYIRIQDNVLDEPDLFDSAYLLVANEFIREFFYILGGLFAPGCPFWDHFREYWRTTTNNTLWERVECGGRMRKFCPGDLEKVGGKLDGVKMSAAALCMLAGQEQDIPRYCRMVDNLNMASQLHNDVVSFVKDLRHDYFTSVIVNTVGCAEGCPDDEVFCRASLAALTGEHLEGWLARAAEFNEAALTEVDKGELPGLAEYVKKKNAHLRGLEKDLVQLKREMLKI